MVERSRQITIKIRFIIILIDIIYSKMTDLKDQVITNIQDGPETSDRGEPSLFIDKVDDMETQGASETSVQVLLGIST